jgi:pimeloyl-ACP methyl ester carboxylesterase
MQRVAAMARRFGASALLLAGLAVAAAAGASHDAAPPVRQVGTLELRACGERGGYCGELRRALDPQGLVAGTLAVSFEYYPHAGPGAALGTLVATEGGPGYPATESRDSYLALFAPLRDARDVLLMDNRGTGRSAAVDCAALQRAPALTIEAIGACGEALGASASLYSTAYAADDLAAILDALGVGTIDLYGDSYGTFFAQVFAVRHGTRLRSLILDGAYPLDAPELAWYGEYAKAMRNKFDRACERSPACSAVPGSSLEHIAPALASLRARPFQASAADADGRLRHFTASAGALATVMFGQAPAYATLRDTDAAARAFAAGDHLPLLRLMAEALAATDSRDATHDPRKFSAGLAAAVTCHDTPQVLDMTLAPAARRSAFEAALAAREARHPDGYAPFSAAEYLRMPPDYSFLDECLDWPVADAAHPAGRVVPPGAPYPDIPVLVISGELDDMTPAADAEKAARQFAHARHVVVGNGWHVNALPEARGSCAPRIAAAFIEDPARATRAAAADIAGCDPDAAPLRLAPPFVRGYARARPATLIAGRHAGASELAAAGAVVATLGDVLPRLAASSGRGVGLRGGRFVVSADGERLSARLAGIRWAEDLAVSGTVEWTPTHGEARAQLRFHTTAGPSGRLTIRWSEGAGDARARIDGRIDGRAITASALAP